MKKVFLSIRISIIFLLALIILNACNNLEDLSTLGEIEKVEISYDFLRLYDVRKMADEATDIIRGEVLEQRVERKDLSVPREAFVASMMEQGMTQEEIDVELYYDYFGPHIRVMTIYTIYVLEVFQGNHKIGDVIEAMRPGGEYENEYWFISDAIELMINTEFVLFLYTHGLTEVPYVFMSPIQGVYYLPSGFESDEKLMEIGYFVELEKASDLDPIIVTVEDLIEIAEENGLLNEESFFEENDLLEEDYATE